MNILALPNSFKGSLTARETARLLQHELSPRHTVFSFPISDGGDGFIDFFQMLDPKARLIRLKAKNAFLKNKLTSYLFLSDRKTAVIETALICGLGAAKKSELDPLGASSYGIGQVILDAVKRGATAIYIGLGGVACNDGGAGMAAALGVKFTDRKGFVLPPGAEPLLHIYRADCTSVQKMLKRIKIYAVADVTNPMLGPKSSAKVFGPQKGATPEQVKILDKALSAYARITFKTTGRDIGKTPSTAAAGAICAGLYGYLHAEILLGAELLLQKAKLQTHFKNADLIVTTEGKLDVQTFYGKAPLAVLKMAKKYKKQVLFICGDYEEKGLRKYAQLMPEQIAVLTDLAKNKKDAQSHASKYILQICKII